MFMKNRGWPGVPRDLLNNKTGVEPAREGPKNIKGKLGGFCMARDHHNVGGGRTACYYDTSSKVSSNARYDCLKSRSNPKREGNHRKMGLLCTFRYNRAPEGDEGGRIAEH